jgi:hypothetical protein
MHTLSMTRQQYLNTSSPGLLQRCPSTSCFNPSLCSNPAPNSMPPTILSLCIPQHELLVSMNWFDSINLLDHGKAPLSGCVHPHRVRDARVAHKTAVAPAVVAPAGPVAAPHVRGRAVMATLSCTAAQRMCAVEQQQEHQMPALGCSSKASIQRGQADSAAVRKEPTACVVSQNRDVYKQTYTGEAVAHQLGQSACCQLGLHTHFLARHACCAGKEAVSQPLQQWPLQHRQTSAALPTQPSFSK